MYISNSGNGADMVIYTFRFYQIDVIGNEINPLSMIYRDNPIRGVISNELNLNLFSTSITEELILTVDE